MVPQMVWMDCSFVSGVSSAVLVYSRMVGMKASYSRTAPSWSNLQKAT